MLRVVPAIKENMVQSESWKQLFESIRPADQECMVVSISGGMDVAVQSISRVEDEVVLIRGRISGQADSGRLFVLPYDRINGFYVNRFVQVEEVELFSPSVSLQRKDQVAKMVQAMKEKAREEAQAAEQARGSGQSGGGLTVDVRKQLEELREKTGFGNTNPPAKKDEPAALPAPNTGASTGDKPKPSTGIPGRPTLPKRPGSDK